MPIPMPVVRIQALIKVIPSGSASSLRSKRPVSVDLKRKGRCYARLERPPSRREPNPNCHDITSIAPHAIYCTPFSREQSRKDQKSKISRGEGPVVPEHYIVGVICKDGDIQISLGTSTSTVLHTSIIPRLLERPHTDFSHLLNIRIYTGCKPVQPKHNICRRTRR